MPREANPNDKIARLKLAKAEFKRGQTCNKQELAAAMGDTPSALTKFINDNPDFPIVQRGGSGVDFVFDAHKALNFMIAWWQTKIKAREEKAARLARLAGIEVASDTGGGEFSIAELRAVQSIQRDAQRMKLDQGLYTLTADAGALFSTIFSIVQTDYLGIRPALDSAGHWSPELAEQIEDFMRTRLVKLHKRIEGVLRKYEDKGEAGG